VQRKLLQIAFAFVGELVVAPLLFLWQRHVARVAQCNAPT
jgi:hypothetical protein